MVGVKDNGSPDIGLGTLLQLMAIILMVMMKTAMAMVTVVIMIIIKSSILGDHI